MISRRRLMGGITLGSSMLLSGCVLGRRDSKFLITGLSIELDDEREELVYAVTVDISYAGEGEETQDVVLLIDDEEYDRRNLTIRGQGSNDASIEVVIFEIQGDEFDSGTYQVEVATDDDERSDDLVIPSG